jgi:hypothetical protein
MLQSLATSRLSFAPRHSDSGRPSPIPADSDHRVLVMAALKAFAILVGQGEAAPQAKIERKIAESGDLAIGTSGHRLSERTTHTECGIEAVKTPCPEARYAYYRRCQQFRSNGEQCKAPALKGEPICYRHAEQADMERRRARQRREILSRPGAGLGSFRAIQRTLDALAGALLAESIDQRTWGRLIVDIQIAIRLQKKLAALRQRYEAIPARSFIAQKHVLKDSREGTHEVRESVERAASRSDRACTSHKARHDAESQSPSPGLRNAPAIFNKRRCRTGGRTWRRLAWRKKAPSGRARAAPETRCPARCTGRPFDHRV